MEEDKYTKKYSTLINGVKKIIYSKKGSKSMFVKYNKEFITYNKYISIINKKQKKEVH